MLGGGDITCKSVCLEMVSIGKNLQPPAGEKFRCLELYGYIAFRICPEVCKEESCLAQILSYLCRLCCLQRIVCGFQLSVIVVDGKEII